MTPIDHSIILVVEDNQVNQLVAYRTLEKLGYMADIACDGKEAVSKSMENQYALIFMDCQMPGMDGYEATRWIREKENVTGKRTPIIALTANATSNDREKCMACGMDDFISKPFKRSDLTEIIKKWMPRDSIRAICK